MLRYFVIIFPFQDYTYLHLACSRQKNMKKNKENQENIGNQVKLRPKFLYLRYRVVGSSPAKIQSIIMMLRYFVIIFPFQDYTYLRLACALAHDSKQKKT